MSEWEVRVNKNSVSGKLKKIEAKLESAVKDELKQVADALIGQEPKGQAGVGSPVDTGAYITSHSFEPTGSGGGRMRTSSGKPKNQSWSDKAQEARTNLYSDIDRADVTKDKAGIFRNRSPHATAVESKYNVYLTAKDRFR